MRRTLLLKSHQTLSTIIYIIVGCLKAESKLILHPYSFYLSVWIRPHLLDSIFFSTFLVNYCGFLNISWKRGIFNFFFPKRVVWVSRKTHQLPLLCYVCVYIYIAVPIHALWDNLVEQRCLWIKFLFYFWVSLFCGSGFDNCCSNGCC